MKLSELLTDESKWCQGTAAKSANGKPRSADSKHAARFCILGAIDRCYPPEKRRDVEMKLINRIFGDAIRKNDGKRKLGMCLSVWNDTRHRTFSEVRKVILECGL